MSVRHIKKNDTVIAVTGADAGTGKTGKVLEVNHANHRAIVEGLNLRKKALPRTQETPEGGITEQEGTIAVSNLMLYCPNDKKGVRVRRTKDGKNTIRKCAICGHSFDS